MNLKNAKATYIGCFHRTPGGSVNCFIDNIEAQTDTYTSTAAHDLVLFGDANIDTLINASI